MGISREDVERIAKASAQEITKRLRPKSTIKDGTKTELTQKWYERGVVAGKTDGWMDVESTMKETLEAHPEIKEPTDLVWTDIEGWETTDHFTILYGSRMMADARGDIDLYLDLKSEFWEGYLAGRNKIGIDIYKIASDLVKAS